MPKLARPLFRSRRLTLVAVLVAAAGCSGSDTTSQGAEQGVALTVAPSTARVAPAGRQLFAATVTGTADTSVTWSVSPGCGAITSTGTYTAPPAVATCQVVATSNADATKTATALVDVQVAPPVPSGWVWAPLKVGAGGWVHSIDIDPSGTTYVVRTDTYGAYVSDGASPWRQLVTADSMSASSIASWESANTPWFSQGVYEIRVAPSNANRLFMIYAGSAWRSDDRGASWFVASSGYAAGAVDPNDNNYRQNGEKMAVDPANPDVVYAGASTGLYGTTNGGTSWSRVTAVPAPTTPAMAITGIAFDPSSGTTGGRTNVVYATSNGNGVYRTADAGVTWSLLTGGPTTCSHAAVGSDGRYYHIVFDPSATSNTLYRYVAGAWATAAVNPGGSRGGDLRALTVDPFNPARVIVGCGEGPISISTDGGVTFSGWNTVPYAAGQTRTATDVPWLATANETSLSNSAMRLDPVTPNKLWMPQGIGVWYQTNPSATSPNAWISFSGGIEQLVANDVLAPPGSSQVFVAGMDRSVFRVDRSNTAFPTDYVKMGSTASLIAGHAIDYSRLNPQHLAVLINGQNGGDLSGYSLDGGLTWTRFPSQPGPGSFGGDIIVPSIDNIIVLVGPSGVAYRSTDRGASWRQLAGVPTGIDGGGWGIRKHVLAIDGGYDGVSNRTLYLYAEGSGTWRSTDDGATWSRVNTFVLSGDHWSVKLRSVPGQPGHLFLTQGQQGGSNEPHPWTGDSTLRRSVDGGVTWTQVTGCQEAYDVAVGKEAPGHAYPAVYFAGWYNKAWGIWRSIDFDSGFPTWTNVGPFANRSLDFINIMKAAPDVYGELYVGFGGSGWARGTAQ